MHLGLKYWPFVPHIKSWEPCGFTEANMEVKWLLMTMTVEKIPVQENQQQINLTRLFQKLWNEDILQTLKTKNIYYIN